MRGAARGPQLCLAPRHPPFWCGRRAGPWLRAAGMSSSRGGLWSAEASLQQGESSLRQWCWPLGGRRDFSYTALSINVPLRWFFPPPPGRVAVPGLPRCCDTMLALSAGSCRCLASLWPLLWNAGGRRSLSPSW